MFIIFFAVSIIIAIAFYRKVGIWGSIVIAIALPVCLYLLATILMIVGGDK